MPVIGHYPQALGYYPTHGPYGSQLEYGDISSSLQGQPGGQVELESVSSSMSYTPLPHIPPAAQAQATFINPAGQATVLQSKRSDLVRSSHLTLHYLGNIRSSPNRSPPQFLQEMPFIGHWHYPQALSTLGDHPTHGHYRSQPEYEDRRSLPKANSTVR
ncbi:hypothetical protein BGW80DRAFT_372784 [Lactifluus volemus]|nr:hypothetical protein BGW80DRAFT_372784 [Lactifluus volemus]